jgi:hypothetical protein
MAAKVIWYREAWWVRTHHARKKQERRIGPRKADKRIAEQIAHLGVPSAPRRGERSG